MAKRSLQVQEQYKQKVENAFTSLGLTQQDFAEARLQLSRSTVSNFLRGKSINRENFIKICAALNLEWEEITGLKVSKVDNANLTESAVDTHQSSTDTKFLVNKLREQVKADIETRCGTMRILDMSHPVGLKDIYTKVNILEKISGRTRKNITELISNCDLDNFDRFNFGQVKEKIPGKEAVSKYRTLLILGKPGAGKTTFLKHLVIQCSRGLFQGDLVPFFVTLKDFAEAENKPGLFTYLDAPQFSLEKAKISSILNHILKQGKALICLDGLDEVLAQDSKRVIKEIENLVHNYPDNQYLMTCRIAAKEYTFEKFDEVEIADFGWEQITTFATNWFTNKPVKPGIFLTRLEKDKPIQELASNPLLLTLLCLAFEESGDFPGNRAGLYKEGLDALLKKWDAKRGIKRDQVYQKLWIQRKEDLLSKTAWETFEPGEYFFKQDKVERYIGEYIRNLPGANTDEAALKLDSEAVLKSIESQHGLLVERAKHIYSFSHLSFQEYFTAREIIQVRQSSDAALRELVSHLFDKRWREVFLLAVAMSPNAEKLVLLMKHNIDHSLAKDKGLQVFLAWLNQKATSVEINYSSKDTKKIQDNYNFYVSLDNSLSRMIYLNFDLGFNLNRNLDRNLDRNLNLYIDLYLHLKLHLNLYIDLYLYLYLHLYLKLYLKLKLGPNLGLNLDLNRNLNLYLKLYLNLELAKEYDFQLHEALLKLKKRLPKEKNTNEAEFKAWWEENGKTWSQDYRNTIIKFQNIGHDWQFSEAQKASLEQYYLANQLLTQCLYQDCYVSPEVRQEIEETILLPMAEIEKRKNNV